MGVGSSGNGRGPAAREEVCWLTGPVCSARYARAVERFHGMTTEVIAAGGTLR